ncbi:MAG: 1-acyl-sn-glycerol-3-phosphate acyltransferase [Luminiphilus sp.]|nr:1-acyl-sn-glycerol-3-phosphate acyltransferase [Luminiphilus sp.]MBL6900695.1 1-acyl-sn-glycerol-3-phosphate acyltransferase [Luminiphilus sp.]
MLAIRSLLVFLIMAVTVIPIGSILVVSSFIAPYRVTYFWIGRPWLQLAMAATRYVGGVRTKVSGYQNLLDAADGNRVIVCSKHQSTLETFLYPSIMTNPVAYVYKKELRWVPFFGWSIGRLQMVPIDRSAKGDAWQRVATIGAKLMDQGKWIIMFPEGTRAARGDQRLYKSGAARLALETGAVVVPIAAATGRCWPRKTWRFIPGEVDISIGPALKAEEGEDAIAFMKRVETWIETEMRIIDAQAYLD